jgi:serine/threonine protein kinase
MLNNNNNPSYRYLCLFPTPPETVEDIAAIATSGADPLGGQTINGLYRIGRLLGHGGMGNVYEAAELPSKRRVALKVMSREFAADKKAVALFHREAELTTGLAHHPNIVQAFDFGVAQTGQPYLVMEFLQGEDLDHRLRRSGRLSAATVLRVIKQTASALAATHAKGIIHQDLKPANIFLQHAEGQADDVKVLDFGICKVCRTGDLVTPFEPVMGTPHYMSPEQALGLFDTVDERTDQWALACVAWEALSGRPPFLGSTIQSLLFQVVYESPSTRVPSGLSPRLESVLLRALSKRKEARFDSVLAFSEAMGEAMDAREGVAPLCLGQTEATAREWFADA